MSISVSLVLLVHNRLEVSFQCLARNLESAGYPVDEIILVDNGSKQPELIVHVWQKYIQNRSPDVFINHEQNLGVAKGYNRGMLLSTCSHIVITGSDRIMPNNWLKHWAEAFHYIPNTGVISLYSHPTEASLSGQLESRYLSTPYEVPNWNVLIRESMACEARIHSRDFLMKAGFFREDLGLYGYEDVEWVERAKRVAQENGLINYCLADQPLAQHVIEGDTEDYKTFKKKENDQPWKAHKVVELWKAGNPYYNPYFKI